MFKSLLSPLFLAGPPVSVPEGTYLAVIPEGLTSKHELLIAYQKELGFPGYFNPGNWDSFDECLRVLDGINEQVVMIFHKDLPLAAEGEELRIYLDILQYCVAFNEAYIGRTIIVAFPLKVQEKVAEVYKASREREVAMWVTPYDISDFTFVPQYDSSYIPEDCDLLVNIPSGIRTRQELIAALPRAIDPWLLPRTKGWLGVMESIGGCGAQIKHFCIIHDDLPLEDDGEELKCYLDVLLTVNDIYTRSGFTKFDVLFPDHTREHVARCLFELKIEREQWKNGADLRR